jgi:hypothetical protein
MPSHRKVVAEEASSSTEKKFVCPECKKDDFRDARALGTHRHFVHGVSGSSTASVAWRQKHKEELAARKIGRPKKQFADNSQIEQKPALSAAMVGYALGKVESLVSQIAQENEIPETDFIPLVMKLYFQLAKS